MTRLASVDLFAEDRAHEELLKPLIERVAREEQVAVRLQVRSARGGHGRALAEYKNYQLLLLKGVAGHTLPDLTVVAIDGNCATHSKKRQEIDAATDPAFHGRVVAACPDPHVERWYMADMQSFYELVGVQPRMGQRKCERDYYKKLLTKTVQAAGHPSTLGGIEFANELAQGMDLYRAGRAETSLKAFVSDLKATFQYWKHGGRD